MFCIVHTDESSRQTLSRYICLQYVNKHPESTSAVFCTQSIQTCHEGRDLSSECQEEKSDFKTIFNPTIFLWVLFCVDWFFKVFSRKKILNIAIHNLCKHNSRTPFVPIPSYEVYVVKISCSRPSGSSGVVPINSMCWTSTATSPCSMSNSVLSASRS